MVTLYIVRQGRTDWNDKRLIQGTVDIELNEEGIKGAKELAEEIPIDEIDICLSSPLKRARKTAEIITKGRVEIINDDDLKERWFGDWEGKDVTYEWALMEWDYNLNESSHGEESIKECLDRGKRVLDLINIDHMIVIIFIRLRIIYYL